MHAGWDRCVVRLSRQQLGVINHNIGTCSGQCTDQASRLRAFSGVLSVFGVSGGQVAVVVI